MRDLIDKITNITEERTLTASTITKYHQRFDKFIQMIREKIPFYTVDKTPVIADPSEADRFQQMFDAGQFKGNIKIKLDGSNQELPLGNLLKTKDLGGQASTGQEGEETGKEAALLKPSQINITDQDIPAAELGDYIINNEVLKSTDYGKVVIQMAETILSGKNPVIPKEIPIKIRDSIIDYAGEYLGVLALVQGTSRFPRRQSFEKWLGNDVSSLVINFPSKSNTNIADSFASIKNQDTEHTINISSKGRGGGAPPSISGLKVSDEIRNNPDYAASVAFIDLCNSSKQGRFNLPEPKSISQVFQAMNLLHEYVPESIPEKFNKFLPWPIEIVQKVVDSIDAFKQRKNLPLSKYSSVWKDIDFKKPSSDGGKLTFAVKVAVMKAINEGQALPEFQDVILAILDMNFIQQYSDYDAKSRTMTFATQWPAKLEGKVTLDSKAGATDPTKGGFSFKLSNNEPKTVLREPDELGGSSNIGPTEKEFNIGAEKIATGHSSSEVTPDVNRQVGDVGRKKR